MVTPNGRWGAFWLLPAGPPRRRARALSRRLQRKAKPSVRVCGRLTTTNLHFSPNARHIAGIGAGAACRCLLPRGEPGAQLAASPSLAWGQGKLMGSGPTPSSWSSPMVSLEGQDPSGQTPKLAL